MRNNILIVIFYLFLHVIPFSSHGASIKVACIGNSITYGTGIKNKIKDSYPSKLQVLLGNNYIVKNFGLPSATLAFKGYKPYVNSKEFSEALTFKPDIVIMHLGINDTDPNVWPLYKDQFIKDYISLIDSFRQINPQSKILIAKLTPISVRHHRFQSGTRDWLDEIQTFIERIPLYRKVKLFSFYEDLYCQPQLFPDGLHPNEEGAQLMAKIVYSAITGNYGGLKVSPLFSDNMVIQRDKPILINGIANANDQITITLGKQKHHSITNELGKWEVKLNPIKAGQSFTLTISSPDTILSFKNVIGGDVWLCSGQSNMAFKLKDSDVKEIKHLNLNDRNLRLYNLEAKYPTNQAQWDKTALNDVNHLRYYKKSSWQLSTSKIAPIFSAIAYHFGKQLRDSLQVPIGLICNAVGGSPTEAWIDRKTLEYDFPNIFLNWTNNDFIQPWVRNRAKINTSLTHDALQRHPFHPSYLYEASIKQLASYNIKGVIWYQGESNADKVANHHKLFKLLIKSWRKTWNNQQLPFFFVQLSSLNRPTWAEFRNDQKKLSNEIPYCYMAVSSDLGDSLNVHPIYKEAIGKRLALLALNKIYNHSIISDGPSLKKMYTNKNKLYLEFNNANDLHGSNRPYIIGFEISENGDFYYPAKAVVKKNIIILQSLSVKHPQYVRYGWQPYTRANLVNKQNLPCSTFKASIYNIQ